jgi:hypothetical protein
MAALRWVPTNAAYGRTREVPKYELPLTTTIQQRPHQYNNQGYLPNGAPAVHQSLPTGAVPLLPNQGRVIQTGGVRVLCVADVRGM